jgi:hypothetical protein
MDGRVLVEALEDDLIERQPIRSARAGDGQAKPQAGGLSEGERSELEQRLRGLGYL